MIRLRTLLLLTAALLLTGACGSPSPTLGPGSSRDAVTHLTALELDDDLKVGDDATVSGDLQIGGDYAVAGDTAFAGDLAVTGKLSVDGSTSLSDTLVVTGTLSDPDSALTVADNLLIDGTANVTQFTIQGHSTQTNPYLLVETSAGVDLLAVDSAGNILAGTGPSLSDEVAYASSGGGTGNYLTDSYGTVGGGEGNRAGNSGGTVTDSSHATVGGGYANLANGRYSAILGGSGNQADGNYSAVGGGLQNQIHAADQADDGRYSFIGGGSGNAIHSTGDLLTICGGYSNLITGTLSYATIGGGYGNEIASGDSSVVAGGAEADVSGAHSAVGGGYDNDISAAYAAIPGGRANRASAAYCFAAGYGSQCAHPGSFVWSDSDGAGATSVATDTVTLEASGGFYLTGPMHLELGATAITTDTLASADERFAWYLASGANTTLTLPAAAQGLSYCLYNYDGADLYLDVQAGDQIHALTDAAGDRVTNTTQGDSLCLLAVDASTWIAIQRTGTWSDAD